MKATLARSARLGRKGHIFGQILNDAPPVPERELAKQLSRRIKKAEKDERMDITMALTPVKTYMGGFTRPKEFRMSNWLSGGRYLSNAKMYETPHHAAYEPHTIFLLESRYPIKFGVGRTECVDHIVAFCRAVDFDAVLKRYNSLRAPSEALESMDNARWPWTPQKRLKRVLYNLNNELKGSLEKDEDDLLQEPVVSPNVAADLATSPTPPRRERPERPKDKLKQTEAVVQRHREADLSTVNAEIISRQEKVPFEVEHSDGTFHHPSGFQPPTSANGFAQSPLPPPNAVDMRPVRQGSNNPDAAVDAEQWKVIRETESKDGALMADLTASAMVGDVVAHTEPRNEKIPTEVSGVVTQGSSQPPQHASGFIPPTPAMARGETEALTHTVISDASDSDKDAVEKHQIAVATLRKEYSQVIKNEPFWRPLLALTVATRPMGASIVRLSRSLSRGLPFHATLDNHDRKSTATLGNRFRCLRLQRMEDLAVEMAQLLAGARGGLVGIRFSPEDRGRGLNGEGLDAPIPWEKRVIGVGIGSWYERAEELKETYRIEGEEEVKQKYLPGDENDAFLIYDLDESGRTERKDLPWQSQGDSDTLKIPSELQDVLDEISELVNALDEERDLIADPIYVLVPAREEVRDAEGYLVEPQDVAPVVLVKSASREPPPGFHLLSGGQARKHMKNRIDYLNKLHKGELARHFASRLNQVVYP
ncbi:uncharacterized protein BT62DRAFT_936455 [Guyanagaster necrorhizus]|uniref:Uncharacterized protein n=1 Tax=Guyanagaster necrorhizus TaxID=856835 RepID=A0A9P7VJZ5_9AGAR|nr:uncharacterized protein BT62DRAFT_936455 [Guyanagaster necrorhizus MCA 3950]KAG7442104.1 hypothetical protein BT62DRAFT_936455 [Guyanagaster necrorhizus MCA 3950]